MADAPELTATLETPPPKQRRKPTGSKRNQRKVDAHILELALKDIPSTQIAKIVDRSPFTVDKKLQEFKGIFTALERVSDYRELKTDLLSAGELMLLESALDPAKLAESSTLNSAKSFEILHKANRLEQGLSTDNQAHKFFGKVTIEGLTKPQGSE